MEGQPGFSLIGRRVAAIDTSDSNHEHAHPHHIPDTAQVTMMQSAVESAGYASNSENVRDAAPLGTARRSPQMELARLKKAYDGMASGEGRAVDANTLLAELKAEARKRG